MTKSTAILVVAGTTYALPMIVGMMNAAAVHAQSAIIATPKFEAVSIRQKLAPDGLQMTRPHHVGNRAAWTDVSLGGVLRYVFQLSNFQFVGKVPEAIYDIQATMDGSPSDDQLRSMFQALLEDRFRLKVHRENRETKIYALIVDKKGTKLKPAEEDFRLVIDGQRLPAGLGGVEGGVMTVRVKDGVGPHLIGKKADMLQLANALRNNVDRSVVDQTGLRGVFDFDVPFSPDDAPPNEAPYPSLRVAIQDQLGLRLVATVGPVEFVVIDHIEGPSEN